MTFPTINFNPVLMPILKTTPRMGKKTKKLIKPRKLKIKKPNRKKKPIKPIKILKKSTGSVLFRFYKQKTEPNPNKKKPSQTGKTEPKPKKTGPKPRRTGLNQFLS
jgi:hypothetical protein